MHVGRGGGGGGEGTRRGEPKRAGISEQLSNLFSLFEVVELLSSYGALYSGRPTRNHLFAKTSTAFEVLAAALGRLS